MRIPYLNTPCILNETCFHGQCIHVNDFLMDWYEFCLCHRHYSGYDCSEQTRLNRTDWFIILTCLTACLAVCLCLLCVPVLYSLLKSDFYPQVIECSRSTPYIEVSSSMNGMHIYRIPSAYLTQRRSFMERLIPLHSISSLAYLARFRNAR